MCDVHHYFLILQLLMLSKEIDMRELDFLLRFNIDHSYISPLDFLSNTAWSAIKVQYSHSHTLTQVFIFKLHIHTLSCLPGDEFH